MFTGERGLAGCCVGGRLYVAHPSQRTLSQSMPEVFTGECGFAGCCVGGMLYVAHPSQRALP